MAIDNALSAEAQKQKARDRAKAWYYANKDRALTRIRQRAKTKRVEVLATQARWREKNRQRLREQQLQYYRKNYSVHLNNCAKRRARKKSALTDPKAISEWMAKIRNQSWVRCHWCGTKVAGNQVHFDHVVAISRGGAHAIDNLCPSCSDCNQKKHNRLIADWICNGQTFLPL